MINTLDNNKVSERQHRKTIFANDIVLILSISALVLSIIGLGVAIFIGNGSYVQAEMTFNENDTYNVLRVDPKKGTIQAKIELLEGGDNTSYKIYYKRGYESSYKIGASIYYMDVGESSGPHDIVYQKGWWNWDIKTSQVNNLSSTTYKISETIKLK